MEVPTYCYENSNHFFKLNAMRHTGKMCDVIIKVEDREIHAHKVILAANIKYFETMFLNSFQECKQNVIIMENVLASDLEPFINYAYTGQLVLTKENALGLLEIANYLAEDVIKKACIDLLIKHMKQEQACRAFKFANAIECFSLKYVAKSTILSNFRNCSQTDGYLDLDVDSLKDILSSANTVFFESEEILFESAVKWIASDVENRRNHINDLLNLVELTKLPSDWLLNYLCRNIKKENYSGVIEDIMSFYNNIIQEVESKTRKLRQYLILIDTIENKNNHCIIQYYDFIERTWSKSYEIAVSNSNIVALSAIVLKDRLYAFVRTEMRHETHLRVFCPTTKQCEVLTFDSRLLGGVAMCACSKYLYFCGGWVEDCTTSLLEQIIKYDPAMNSFETLPPMGTKRAHAAAIFYEGYLYVLGGHDGSHILNSVEKYDPKTKKWLVMPAMSEERYLHAVAILDGKLYVCGGESKKSVEFYDSSTNRWKLVANMNRHRHGFLLVAYENKLLAIRGKYEKTTEVYEPSENQWQMDMRFTSGLEMKFPAGGTFFSCNITEVD